MAEDKGMAMAVVQLPDAASRHRTRAVTARVDEISSEHRRGQVVYPDRWLSR